MELKWLEDALALFEEKSFSKAAKRRNVTQPAFSRRIQNLENWLGSNIVNRGTNPVTILDGSYALEPEIRSLARRFQELKSIFRTANQNLQRLDVASQHNLAASVFPQVMEMVTSALPNTSFNLRAGNLDDCITMCLKGETDFLLAYKMDHEKPSLPDWIFEEVSLGTDCLLPVCSPALHQQLSIALLSQIKPNANYLAYPETSFLGRVVNEFCIEHLETQFRPEYICEAAFTTSLKELCIRGLGLSWLPMSLIEQDIKSGALKVLPPRLPSVPMEISLHARRSNAGAIELLRVLPSLGGSFDFVY